MHRRAGMQHDRAFGKDQRRILDKDRVGKLLQRIQHSQREACLSQRRGVAGVFGNDILKARIRSSARAQALEGDGRALREGPGRAQRQDKKKRAEMRRMAHRTLGFRGCIQA